MPTPWIAPDEMIYGLLGQSLYRTGHLAILGGPTPYYSAVVPLVAGLPLSVSDLAGGYSVLKVVQALVISLAAVPVYFWARSVVPRRWALVAAALTLALPGLAYSGLVMSEVEFYPALVLAAWAMAAAIASPTRRHGLLALGALVLAIATRTQAVILLPALVIALVLDALLARSLRRLAAHVPLLAGVALLAAAGALWRLAAAGPFLGGYAGAGGHVPGRTCAALRRLPRRRPGAPRGGDPGLRGCGAGLERRSAGRARRARALVPGGRRRAHGLPGRRGRRVRLPRGRTARRARPDRARPRALRRLLDLARPERPRRVPHARARRRSWRPPRCSRSRSGASSTRTRCQRVLDRPAAPPARALLASHHRARARARRRGGRVPVRDRPAPRPPRPARARRPGARRRVGVGEP